MHSAFGIEHGTFSKKLKPHQIKSLRMERAVSGGSLKANKALGDTVDDPQLKRRYNYASYRLARIETPHMLRRTGMDKVTAGRMGARASDEKKWDADNMRVPKNQRGRVPR